MSFDTKVDAVKGALYIGIGMFFGNVVGEMVLGIIKLALSSQ